MTLFILFKQFSIGCHLKGAFTGALSYAGDITLCSHSIRGYGTCTLESEPIYMGDDKIKWMDNMKHVGNH